MFAQRPRSEEAARRIQELRETLAARFKLRDESYEIGGMKLHVVAAGNTDDLLEELIAAGPNDPAYQDERLPYWVEVWPGSVALAQYVLTCDALCAGRQALEIGCGLGLAGLAAMAKGAETVFTDYQADALAFVELNALINMGHAPETAVMDWRAPSLDQQFDVILAADVAYEKRFFEPLAATFRKLLKPGGVVLLSEPGRRIAHEFFVRLAEQGVQSRPQPVEIEFRGQPQKVTVHEIRFGTRDCAATG